ncbi:unnamed protein product [Chilo suppressalis]|uniref:Uncharacterized protein n=1 Tax=Chilo suppressalis TaxID=168631 RepID=A0ABN8B295_CHISP|nr:unnamed protein product [Chilo suppressalis]
MTKTISIVLALSLFVNEITILYNARILKTKYLSSNLVFLMAVCLVLKRVNVLPKILWRNLSPICFIIEIITTLVLLECSLFHIWKRVEDYLLYNSDGLLVHLSENSGLQWLVCHLCCGRSNCSAIFAHLVLKMTSFFVLLASCCFISSI